MSNEIAEMQAQIAAIKCWLDLHTETFTDLVAAARLARERVGRLEAKVNPDLAESLISGVRHDAEVLRRQARIVRLHECEWLRGQLLQQYGYSPKAATIILLTRRIRELEAEEV